MVFHCAGKKHTPTEERLTMKVIIETSLDEFKTWCGATPTKERIIAEEKEDEFEQLIEEEYPDGIEEMQLNDLLWFDDDWIYEMLGMTEEEEEEEEE